ncbi:MAG TPA: DUF2914 domain-containing protein [Vicinamibacterales bacterium]|nr:DUF2914 domain-containing protein [Vicinamibacterales bacterium]
MTDERTPQSLVDAAEQAVGSGDYTSAERLLREAAAIQEAALGPLHPDLANTLNNLGVVCEITDNPVDAEHYFRRACAIATAVLPPEHPFVATSRKNLEDFCAARGKPVNLPAAVSLAVNGGPIIPPTTARAATDESRTATLSQPAKAARGKPGAAATAAAILVVAVVAATMAWLRFGDSSPLEQPVDVRPQQTPPPPAHPEPAVVAPPVERADLAAREAVGGETPAGEARAEPATRKAAAPSPPTSQREITAGAPEADPPAAAPEITVARLCRTLSTSGGSRDWLCQAADGSIAPGRMYFYTRLRSPRPITVQHRWYQGDRVRRAVSLRIAANMIDGYRTYSRMTVDAGEWRVELRTRDGLVVHETRFTVR